MTRQASSSEMGLGKMVAYLWASPTTLLGVLPALSTRVTGGRLDVVDGVMEVSGGFAASLLRCRWVGANAMTLGHIVLGVDAAALDSTRAHERVHVRQAEICGPFFVPAYLAASAWAWLRGRHYYRDNWFERDAFRRAGR
jgi:hypothetical protein